MSAAVSPWAWHAHPDVWALLIVLGVGYPLALTRLAGARPAGEPVATRRQKWTFGAGLFVLWLASDWPIHDIAEKYLLSAHMVQHLLLTLIAPPLLMLGVPPWLMRRLLAPRFLHAVFSRLARPFPAAVLFNTVVAVSHWPALVDTALRSEPVHFSVHAALVTTAVLMWFPVLNRLPEYPRLGEPARMVYLFLQSIIPTVPASFLTFGDGVLYKFYEAAPRPFAISAIEDQQVAGAVMKVAGGGILWGIIVVMFFRWYASSERDKGDVLTWDDVQRELERTKAPG